MRPSRITGLIASALEAVAALGFAVAAIKGEHAASLACFATAAAMDAARSVHRLEQEVGEKVQGGRHAPEEPRDPREPVDHVRRGTGGIPGRWRRRS